SGLAELLHVHWNSLISPLLRIGQLFGTCAVPTVINFHKGRFKLDEELSTYSSNSPSRAGGRARPSIRSIRLDPHGSHPPLHHQRYAVRSAVRVTEDRKS